MSELPGLLQNTDSSEDITKLALVTDIKAAIDQSGYTIVEENIDKPWGAYLRLINNQADAFVADFFPGLSPEEARLGNPTAELSPKILIVSPNQRLSWQYHHRRAERWAFVNTGAYNKSLYDEPGEPKEALAGEVVQFGQSERHRLIGAIAHYTLVAEIWQHTDPTQQSDEDDIVRLADDYSR